MVESSPTAGPPFTLRQLQYFVSVAEQGSMAGAAERHFISQSAVSLAVGELERALGVQLFLRRRSRGVELTAAARQVLPRMRSLLAQANDVYADARSLGQVVAGDLSLGCFPTLTPFLLPEILRRLPERHPDVAPHLVEGTTSELSDRLADGTCEVALMYDLGLDPAVATTTLYRVRPYVLVGAGHRLARAGPIDLCELRDEPMVMLDMPPSATLFTEVLATADVEPRVRYTTASFESVRSLVAGGAGYSLLLQRPAAGSTYAGPALVHREIRGDVPEVDVVLARARDARPTRRAEAFTDLCRELFGIGTS